VDHAKFITETFNRFDGKNLGLLDSFYAADVEFIDPVTRVQGLDDLKAYYAHAYKNVLSIRFEFIDFIIQDANVCAAWSMTLAAKGLNKNRPFVVPGLSHFRFNSHGLVAYHRDYVDLGAMIYERIPIQGKLIQIVKGFLKP
jgi:hypothetical protein